jgi:hypothetical protein
MLAILVSECLPGPGDDPALPDARAFEVPTYSKYSNAHDFYDALPTTRAICAIHAALDRMRLRDANPAGSRDPIQFSQEALTTNKSKKRTDFREVSRRELLSSPVNHLPWFAAAPPHSLELLRCRSSPSLRAPSGQFGLNEFHRSATSARFVEVIILSVIPANAPSHANLARSVGVCSRTRLVVFGAILA